MPVNQTVELIQNSSNTIDQVYSLIFGVLVAAAGAALWIRRKLSKDSLEIKKESAESDLIQHLEDERDVLKEDKNKLLERLIEVDRERQEAVTAVAKLSSDVEYLSKQVSQLENLVQILGSKLDAATASMQSYAIENAKLTEKLKAIVEIKQECGK